jgi:ABC-2 type transport system ATP-binding protein
VVFSAALDDVKETHRCLTLRFDEARPRPPALAGVLSWEGAGREWTALCSGRTGEVQAVASACGARLVGERVPSLDEIFVARAGKACVPAEV